MQVNVILEEEFQGHQGNDLFDMDKAHFRQFRVRKQTTANELMEIFSDTFVSMHFKRRAKSVDIKLALGQLIVINSRSNSVHRYGRVMIFLRVSSIENIPLMLFIYFRNVLCRKCDHGL